LPRTSKAKITPTEVELHRIEAENALAELHREQSCEARAHKEWRATVAARVGAEKDYAAAVRRWKLAEAKLPPPPSMKDTIREILEEGNRLFADGEPVEV
jgi:hypothetical protein